MTEPGVFPFYDLIFLDMSQFTQAPLRTGVQRVLIRAIEHLPRDRIMPFRVIDENTVAILDPALFDLGIRYFRQNTESQRAVVARAHGKDCQLSEEVLLIKLLAANPMAILDAQRFFSNAGAIVNLESFSRPDRARFYVSCPPAHRGKLFHFIHDFLLFEVPETFPNLNWRYASDYILLFEAWCAAGGFFVATSEMAHKVAHYFNRPLSDVHIVHFGGNMANAAASPNWRDRAGRRSVVVVGTIEPRKYPTIVAESLFRIAAYHPDIDCILIGGWGWVEPPARAIVEHFLEAGRIVHHENLADDHMVRLMQSASVGIYVSANEGFGLPVIEFAAMGVPVVTNQAVPSAPLLDRERATILSHVDVAGLVTAVEHLLAAGSPRTPYYRWIWADCAHDIYKVASVHLGNVAEAIDGPDCWQLCARVIQSLRSRAGTPAVTRQEIRRALQSALESEQERSRGARAPLSKRRMASVIEAGTGIVQGNLGCLHWADLAQIEGLLGEIIHASAAGSPLAGLSHAFLALLGRPIDARAASEALRAEGPGEMFARVLTVIESDEAGTYLGDRIRTNLRSVVHELQDVFALCSAKSMDVIALAARLGVPDPSVEDMFCIETFLMAGVGRFEIMLYLAHGRTMRGDVLDIFLEAAARVCVGRGLRIAGGGAISELYRA